VDVTIDAASIETRDPQRDEHLRSPDFLDVASHPQLGFVATSVSRGKRDRWTVVGDLTIRGVTRSVELEVEFAGVVNDPWGNQRAGFSATAEIDREAFGLTWNQTLETGGVLVGKKVRIELEVEAVRA
jgi:polyisoprenoid-binding protein YceI